MADFGTHLSKLQMLKLSKNEITTVVDEAFSKLTRLSQLDLSYNRLRVSLIVQPDLCCIEIDYATSRPCVTYATVR